MFECLYNCMTMRFFIFFNALWLFVKNLPKFLARVSQLSNNAGDSHDIFMAAICVFWVSH